MIVIFNPTRASVCHPCQDKIFLTLRYSNFFQKLRVLFFFKFLPFIICRMHFKLSFFFFLPKTLKLLYLNFYNTISYATDNKNTIGIYNRLIQYFLKFWFDIWLVLTIFMIWFGSVFLCDWLVRFLFFSNWKLSLY